MSGRFERREVLVGWAALAKASVLVALLSACSSVPDAVNPVEWYKGAADLVTGRERPEVASPVPPKGQFPDVNTVSDARKDLPKGLNADRGNAQYAEPVKREIQPTRALARKAPPAEATQVAKADSKATPAVPPKPAVQASPLPDAPAPAATQVAQAAEQPRLSQDRRQPGARDLGPDAPPASVDMNPPPRPDIPETVPAGNRRPKQLQAQFERRLAESAQQVVRPGMVDMPQQSAGYSLARADEAPIHLIPPTTAKPKRGGGGKGLAAPQPEPLPAASFQVAALDFQAQSSKLTRADYASIAEVARLYKQTGGVVRVVGYAPAPVLGGDMVSQLMDSLGSSQERANAVARELTRRGVPAGKILVAADPSVAGTQKGGAQVYLDVM